MLRVTHLPLGFQEDPLEEETAPTPVFLPREFHGQRSLMGYGPWGCKELDTTKQLVLLLFEVKFAQSCLIFCGPMDCSLPGFSVHGILQAGMLEWVAIPFSRGSS